jgi:hypothetical protein
MRAFRLPALLLCLTCLAAFAAPGDRDRDDKRDGDRDRHGPGPDRRPRVTFYEHADFRGASFTLEAGEDAPNLTRMNFFHGPNANDRISSIRIEGGATVLVFRDARFRGGMLRLTHDVHNLSEIERGWNDAISSIRVEKFGGGRR